jgi:hypothetical protein
VVELVEEERRVRIVADRDEEPVGLDSDVSPFTCCAGARRSTLPSPSTSSTTAFSTNSILSFCCARLTMICDARNSSRRWTTVTFEANFVRKSASSKAESPPPTTSTSLSRKNAASQVAQADTPRPFSWSLRREVEPARARARRDDHRPCLVFVVADPNAQRLLGEVDARHVVGENCAPNRSACGGSRPSSAGPSRRRRSPGSSRRRS